MNDEINSEGAREEMEILPEKESELPEFAEKLAKLKGHLGKCEEQKKEYLDGWQRAKADFINYRNEENRRFEEMMQFASGSILAELLPVMDSFELAFEHKMEKEVEKGVLLIRSQLEEILKRHGLEVVVVKIGDAFNPEEHESIGEIDSEVAAGAIAEIAQKGYRLRGKVIRPVRVKLSRGSN